MQTIIRIFEDRHAAQLAVNRLLDAGFQREDVHLEEAAALANTALPSSRSAWERAQTGPERSILSSLGRFLASLFGEDPPSGYVDRYTEAIWHGHPVIVVDATDQEAANRASSMLSELGGLDLDDRSRWHRAAAHARARQMQPRHIFPGSFRAAERDRAIAAARAAAISDRET